LVVATLIRIVIAEDQSLLRGALKALLSLEADLQVVGDAGDGLQALALVKQWRPDILLSDIEMPVLTGLELAQKIRDLELPTRTVIVTTFARPGYLRRALEAGVRGYLLKDAPSEKLADAIRSVHSGVRVLDPELAGDALADHDPLSEREREALRLAGEGLSATAIADQLHLSHGTVRNYLSDAINKLGVSNRVEAYRLAKQKGWL
jgi:two-component system, NarL family, response regulator DesR